MKKKQNKYRCIHCGKVVLRDSLNEWIASYCHKTGKDVHLERIES